MSRTIFHVAYAEVRVIFAGKLWKSFPHVGELGAALQSWWWRGKFDEVLAFI